MTKIYFTFIIRVLINPRHIKDINMKPTAILCGLVISWKKWYNSAGWLSMVVHIGCPVWLETIILHLQNNDMSVMPQSKPNFLIINNHYEYQHAFYLIIWLFCTKKLLNAVIKIFYIENQD